MKIAVTLFIVFALFLPNTFAQDYTLWDAATGAHIRTITLRHTVMSGAYHSVPMEGLSQVGVGTILSVYGTRQRAPIYEQSPPGIRIGSGAYHSVPMEGL